MKLPKYYIIVYLLFLLSKARQAKKEHKEMKLSQPIFGSFIQNTNEKISEIFVLASKERSNQKLY